MWLGFRDLILNPSKYIVCLNGFDVETSKVILEANGHTVSTFYKWLTDFPDFNKAVVEATDLQWKYTNWRIRHGYRGYERHNLNRPSKAYQSPNNVPFNIPPVESEVPPVDPDDDEALWEKWSWENVY